MGMWLREMSAGNWNETAEKCQFDDKPYGTIIIEWKRMEDETNN